MNRKRQKQIEDTAKSILVSTGCYKAPVDVVQVVEKLDIRLEKYDFGDDVSGVYINEGTNTIIGYNITNGEKRQRFTIAHELGHSVLGHKRDGVFIDNPSKYFTILFRDNDSSTGEYLQEREANAFAAALLMPKELIEKSIRQYYNADKIPEDENFDLIEKLCNEFNVSSQAMSFRLTNLDMSW